MPPVASAPGSSSIAVVKVGGSLYDLPELGPRLRRWLAEHFAGSRAVVVPGGGALADALRNLDRRHGLGEENSHWLALRALTVNAYFLAALLPQSGVHGDVGELNRAWDNDELPILDVHEFARRDEELPGRLPHCWAVTSDAVAARVAVVLQARHLVLLKSTTIPQGVDWTEAARLGWVDAMFAEVLRDAPAELRVSAINLRLVKEEPVRTYK
ncbi:MAG: amino acid kinase family protein [Gemmataceae bacterium]